MIHVQSTVDMRSHSDSSSCSDCPLLEVYYCLAAKEKFALGEGCKSPQIAGE